jgi:hypothetical protein
MTGESLKKSKGFVSPKIILKRDQKFQMCFKRVRKPFHLELHLRNFPAGDKKQLDLWALWGKNGQDKASSSGEKEESPQTRELPHTSAMETRQEHSAA